MKNQGRNFLDELEGKTNLTHVFLLSTFISNNWFNEEIKNYTIMIWGTPGWFYNCRSIWCPKSLFVSTFFSNGNIFYYFNNLLLSVIHYKMLQSIKNIILYVKSVLNSWKSWVLVVRISQCIFHYESWCNLNILLYFSFGNISLTLFIKALNCHLRNSTALNWLKITFFL